MTTSRKASKSIARIVDETRSSYQNIALAYEAVSALFQIRVVYPSLMTLLEKHLGSLEGKRLLDVGCGSGTLMAMLEERGAQCVGIDIAPVFLERARERGLHVVEASMHHIPFTKETFDAVVSNYVINYLPHSGQRHALREQFRVIGPGGVTVFTVMHPSLMRLGKRRPDAPYYAPEISDYFRPQSRETVNFMGERLTLYLTDWPDLVSMVIDAGFRLQELVDAHVPKDLEEIASSIENPAIADFVRSFRYNPYAATVVAKKE